MTSQIKWIESASGDTRRHRAMVVGWQNSLYAINQLIGAYNELTIQPQLKPDLNEPMRIIASRRQILASLLELKNRLDEWISQLNKAGLDCSPVKVIKRSLRRALDRAESWRSIRNLTFHYGDIVEAPDDLLTTYSAISSITDREVNDVWYAMIQVGEAAKKIALDRA